MIANITWLKVLYNLLLLFKGFNFTLGKVTVKSTNANISAFVERLTKLVFEVIFHEIL